MILCFPVSQSERLSSFLSVLLQNGKGVNKYWSLDFKQTDMFKRGLVKSM